MSVTEATTITFEVDVPMRKGGKPPLTLNGRLHHMQRHQITKLVRAKVAGNARKAGIGQHEHVTVQLHYATGDNRPRDADNLIATQKPAVDGLRDAGVIPEDTPRHLTWYSPQIHNGPGKRRLWLEVTV